MPTRIDRIARRAPRALVLREERRPTETGPIGRKPMSGKQVDQVLNDSMDRIANTPAPLTGTDVKQVARYLGAVHKRMQQQAPPE